MRNFSWLSPPQPYAQELISGVHKVEKQISRHIIWTILLVIVLKTWRYERREKWIELCMFNFCMFFYPSCRFAWCLFLCSMYELCMFNCCILFYSSCRFAWCLFLCSMYELCIELCMFNFCMFFYPSCRFAWCLFLCSMYEICMFNCCMLFYSSCRFAWRLIWYLIWKI